MLGGVMRAWLVMATVFALLAGPVVAAEAPAASAEKAVKEALVRRYLKSIEFEKLMDTMVGSMTPVMAEQTARRNPSITPDQRQLIVDIVGDAMREVMTPRIIEASVALYADAFSEPELRALVTFYESPEGRAITQKMPALTPKAADMTRALMPQMEQEVQARLCARIDCTPAQRTKARPS